ncbi:S9 family peptidase [Actinomadura alba]|uniref:S9 family peptidase n=1 Tax=Actinomadura alba TaxID=406431 RepID=A0ABR7LP62_9ACTN|nr:prolyl oligopeptidase family serine peptidase [Actinomadura alba]MBC6466642.1 S9 family peptidase [Actinomadura alba]
MTGIPAELVARVSTTYDAVQMIGDTVFWIESRPDGRDVLVQRAPDQGVREAVPADMDVASYVHEYGGGAYLTAGDSVWFCNADDQRIYRLTAEAKPVPVTAEPDSPGTHRYADLRLTPDRSLLICVRERHEVGGVVNELVAIPADGQGTVRTIASGWDFYSFPRPSPDGRWLAWTCWNAPSMPWDATWLFIAELSADGRLGGPTLIAGGSEESIFQPEWSRDGTLHFVSDRSGWWNLYAWRHGEVTPVLLQDAELGVAQWELGYSTYAFLDRDRVAVIAQRGGRQQLEVLEDGAVRSMDLPYTSIKPYLSGHGSKVAMIASSPTQSPAVVLVDVDSGQVEPLAVTDPGVPPRQISIPEPFTFSTRDGQHAYGLYYPPTEPSGTEAPPLIVKAHPGPTANFPQRLDWHTQYFTSRGFAVAEIDYRGSTGYGRSYRQALQGQWGIFDALDCADAAAYLTATGRADPDRLVIWGASAGGYTALRSLILTDVFVAGIARCPVIDPATWRDAAPKFQAHHADELIGPWPADEAIYRERSALRHANRISRPTLVLHGEDDPVTPVHESRTFAKALGSRAGLLTFRGEGHVLRSPAAVEHAVQAELAFVREAGA